MLHTPSPAGEFEEIAVPFTMSTEGHTLFLSEGTDGNAEVEIASRRTLYRDVLAQALAEAKELQAAASDADLKTWQVVVEAIADLQSTFGDFDRAIGTLLSQAKYGDKNARKEMDAWMNATAATGPDGNR